MAAVKLKNKGFGLAEFLAAAGLTAMAAAFLVPAYGGVQKYLLKMQAERAAQCLAGDIAALQQYSFYDMSGKSRLEMDADKGGYQRRQAHRANANDRRDVFRPAPTGERQQDEANQWQNNG